MVKLKKGRSILDRSNYVATMNPGIINCPGLSDIKQVHLNTKWRNLVPEEYRDITCPKPPDDVIKRIKSDIKSKHKSWKVLMYKYEDNISLNIEDEETNIEEKTSGTRKRSIRTMSARNRVNSITKIREKKMILTHKNN